MKTGAHIRGLAILALIFLLFPFLLLDGALAQPAASPWPMFRHDPQHTGRSPSSGPTAPALKWSFAAGDRVRSSPAIGADGTIYVGSYDNKVYAINPDGSQKWAFTTGHDIYSSPAIGADGTIYVGSVDGSLYAINPADGSQKWAFTTGGPIASSPVIGADGTIYIGSQDGSLYAVNPDGSQKWAFATAGFVDSSPAIGDDGTIYVGSVDTKLYAINPADGSQKWSFLTGSGVKSSPAIGADGTIYVGSDDGNLYAINPDGSQKWAFAAANIVESSPGIGADGTIYVGTNINKFHAINPDGTEKWTFTTGGAVQSSPAIGADGTIYVGSVDTKLYAINPDGSQRWSFVTGGFVYSSPAIGADGTIYVGSWDNKLYAIGQAPPAIAIDPASGPVGTSVNVTGTAFAPGETGIQVTFNGAVVAQGIAADENGSWTASFDVAPSPGGAHAVDASGDTTAAEDVADATFTVTPQIALDLLQGPVEVEVGASGTGFGANETDIQITFESPQAIVVASGIAANDKGSWTATFPVPDVAPGDHIVDASGPTTPAASVPDATFKVLSPYIEIDPNNGIVGTLVNVMGFAFAPNEVGISVSYAGLGFDTGPIGSVQADRLGNWEAQLAAPLGPSGQYTIDAKGARTPAGDVPDVIFTLIPSLSVFPEEGRVDTEVEVSGVGFGAGETGIKIAFDGVDVTATATADKWGRWSDVFTIPSASFGVHQVDAHGSATPLVGGAEPVPFQVTPAALYFLLDGGLSSYAEAPVGAPLTLVGEGFQANEQDIQVTLDGANFGNPVNADAQGHIQIDITAPQVSGGLHTWDAAGAATPADQVAEAVLDITPTLAIDPAQGLVGGWSDSLWLGNDGHVDLGLLRMTTAGVHTGLVPGVDVTGIAWDGTNLWTGTMGGIITQRDSQGNPIDSFDMGPVNTGEDLAWDGTNLWRVDHLNHLYQIDVATGTVVATRDLNTILPSPHPQLGQLGALGLAWDGSQLWVSFCPQGCSRTDIGMVATFNPATGVYAERFVVEGFWTGGLDYDSATDTLWVGGVNGEVRRLSLDGQVLALLNTGDGRASDGLALVPAPVEAALASGTGFGAGESVQVLYQVDEDNWVVVADGIVVGEDGTWSAPFHAPPSATGLHTVDAQGTATAADAVPDVTFEITGAIWNERTGVYYPSIQAAVDAALRGDVILVQKGTYTENVSVEIVALTLRSVDPAEDVILQGAADGTPGNTLTVTGSAHDFILGGSGLTLVGDPDGGSVIEIDGATNVAIQGNTILFGGASTGIFVGPANASGLVINGNTLEVASDKTSVYANDGLLTDLAIVNNDFLPVADVDGGGIALDLLGVKDGIIRDNTFDRAGTALRLGGCGACDPLVDVQRVQVMHNLFQGSTDAASGQVFIYDSGGPGTANVEDVALVGNTFAGGAGDGIHIHQFGQGAIEDVSASWNNFLGNAGEGIDNMGSAPVEAEDNWWGDPVGPLGPAGDGVEGDVDYDPWLAGQVHFVHQKLDFNESIQEAIDEAAPGDYVVVWGGTYDEAITINTPDLTILAPQGRDATAIHPSGPAPAVVVVGPEADGLRFGLIQERDGVRANMGFTITGEAVEGPPPAGIQIPGEAASVTIEGNRFLTLGASELLGGIQAGPGPLADLTIGENLFQVTEGREGIHIEGTPATGLYIYGNYFFTLGAPNGGVAMHLHGVQDSVIQENAIGRTYMDGDLEVAEGVDVGIHLAGHGPSGTDSRDVRIVWNDIRNTVGEADIVIVDQVGEGEAGVHGVEIVGNILRDGATDGILVQAESPEGVSGVVIRANNIFNHTGLGANNLLPADPETGEVSPLDARWNWWGDSQGPNGPNGDGVSDNVNFEPWFRGFIAMVDASEFTETPTPGFGVTRFSGVQEALDATGPGTAVVIWPETAQGAVIGPWTYPEAVVVGEPGGLYSYSYLAGLDPEGQRLVTLSPEDGAGIPVVDFRDGEWADVIELGLVNGGSGGMGVRLASGLEQVNISHNIIELAGDGGEGILAAGPVQELQALDNRITGGSTGIYGQVARAEVRNNVLTGGSGAGIRLWGSAGESVIEDNTIQGYTGHGLSLGSDGPAGELQAFSRTFTVGADFDEGTEVGVNHEAVPDQLQLNEQATTLPFIWVAASGRGTIIKIDTETGDILGEYWSAPNGMGRNPSRTTVDIDGSVWAGNRDEGSGGKGSVVKVGLKEAGSCVDRNGNGVIDTSTGLGDIRPWPNAGGVDSNGGTSTAQDECIIYYTRVTGANTRTVAVDKNNDVWTGGADSDHEKVSGATGLPVPGTQFNLGCGGYGGLIDQNGVLWSARFGTNPPLRYDTNTMTGVCLGPTRGDYGFGIDPTTGEIWHTFLNGNQVAKLDSAGNVLAVYGHGEYYAQGVVVDGNGNVWVAHSLIGPSNTVGHLRTDGTFVGNVTVGSGPTGVAVDANGKVWAANYYSSTASRIDPNAGPIGGGGFTVGAVDLTVSLGDGAYPYNYSDMTGIIARGVTTKTGTWTMVVDGGAPGMDWGSTISWTSDEPEGTAVRMRVRTSETDVFSGDPIEVQNGQPFPAPPGRYIQVEVRLTTEVQGVTPTVTELTVSGHAPTAYQVSGNTIEENGGNGVLLLAKGGYILANVTLEGNDIRGNGGYGVFLDGDDGLALESIRANFNNFVGNKGDAVHNELGRALDATLNFWGDKSGPSHPSNLRSNGLGGAITDDVAYQPWLATPVHVGGSWKFDENVVLLDGDMNEVALSELIQPLLDISRPFDTVKVMHEGPYAEALSVATADLTLVGDGDGDGERAKVDFEAGDVALFVEETASRLKVSNFSFEGSPASVVVEGAGETLIRDSQVLLGEGSAIGIEYRKGTAEDILGAALLNSHIQVGRDSIGVEASAVTGLTIRGNKFVPRDVNDPAGIAIQVSNSDEVEIAENSIDRAGIGIAVYGPVEGVAIVGNEVNRSGDEAGAGILVLGDGGPVQDLALTGNFVAEGAGDGYRLDGNIHGLLNVRLGENVGHMNAGAVIYILQAEGVFGAITVKNNQAHHNGDGVVLENVGGQIAIQGNDVHSNQGNGLGLIGVTGALVAENQLHGNALANLALSGSTDNTILENSILGEGTSQTGLHMAGSSGNLAEGNTISGHLADGILLQAPGGNFFARNKIMDNGGAGLRLVNSSGNVAAGVSDVVAVGDDVEFAQPALIDFEDAPLGPVGDRYAGLARFPAGELTTPAVAGPVEGVADSQFLLNQPNPGADPAQAALEPLTILLDTPAAAVGMSPAIGVPEGTPITVTFYGVTGQVIAQASFAAPEGWVAAISLGNPIVKVVVDYGASLQAEAIDDLALEPFPSNLIAGNAGGGVAISGGQGNRLQNNIIVANKSFGVSLESTSGNLVALNLVQGNENIGISLAASGSNEVLANNLAAEVSLGGPGPSLAGLSGAGMRAAGASSDDEKTAGPAAAAMSFRTSRTPTQVAVFMDSYPWGSDAIQYILMAHGISFDVYGSGAMGSIDLSAYDKVVIASVQPTSFYQTLMANKAWFESFVANGGTLQLDAANYSSTGCSLNVELPGGYRVNHCGNNPDYASIVDREHPIVNDPNYITDEELDGWSSSIHGYFDQMPEDAHLIIQATYEGWPAAVESRLGQGTVLATVQTVEWWYASWAYLENMLLYMGGVPSRPSYIQEIGIGLKDSNSNVIARNLVDGGKAEGELVIESLAAAQPAGESNASQSGVAKAAAQVTYRVEAAQGPNILVYTDDYYSYPGETFVEQALQALGLGYTGYYGDPYGFCNALTSGETWDMVLVSHNNYFELGQCWEELRQFYQNGGLLGIETFDIDGSNSESTTLWQTLGISYNSTLWTPLPVYKWDPNHRIWNDPHQVPDLLDYYEGYYDDGDKAGWTGGTAAPGGFTTSSQAGQGAIFVTQDARAVVDSFIVSEFAYDYDDDGVTDGVELWINQIMLLLEGIVRVGPGEVGIALDNSSGNQIAENQVRGHLAVGIGLMNHADRNLVADNLVENNGAGIALFNASSNTIADNEVMKGQEFGIGLMSTSNNNAVQGNLVEEGGEMGIVIYLSSHNLIGGLAPELGNTVVDSYIDIFLVEAGANEVRHNTTEGGVAGLAIQTRSRDNLVVGNTFGAEFVGVLLADRADNNTLEDNAIEGNGEVGAYLWQSSGNSLNANSILGNGFWGALVYGGKGNLLQDNKVQGHGLGIHLLWTKGNTLAGNRVGPLPEQEAPEEGFLGNWWGIVVEGGQENVAQGNQVRGSFASGISLYYSWYNKVEANLVEGNGVEAMQPFAAAPPLALPTSINLRGLRLSLPAARTLPEMGDLRQQVRSEQTTLEKALGASGTVILNGEEAAGILLAWGSDFNQVLGNQVIANAETGILLRDAWNNQINGNALADNELRGIALTDYSLNNVVEANALSGHTETGIDVRDGPRTLVKGNSLDRNKVGIGVQSWQVKVTGNEVQGSADAGIWLEWNWNNMVADNNVHDNATGIRLSSGGHALVNNIIQGNGHGIWVESSDNYIASNTIQANTAPSWVPGEEAGSGIHFARGPVWNNNVVNNNIVGNRETGSWGIWNEMGPEEEGSNPRVNARNNWWGDASGPYAPGPNPGGTGDAVAGEVDFRDWLTAGVAVPDGQAPVAVAALAFPRTLSRLSLWSDFNDDPNMPGTPDQGINSGPTYTTFMVEASDFSSGVARATINLRALVEQMVPQDAQVKPGLEDKYQWWLKSLEKRELYRNGPVFQRGFGLWEIVNGLESFLHENLFEVVNLGDFTVPVTVYDFSGNQTSAGIALTIVDRQIPVKKNTWTALSTPVTLEEPSLGDVLALGGGLDISAALRWNSAAQQWEQVLPSSLLRPLEGVMVRASEDGQVPLIYSRGLSAPSQIEVNNGWNLRAISVAPPQKELLPLSQAFISVEQKAGVRGYTAVLSPNQWFEQWQSLCYQPQAWPAGKTMCFGGYYWRNHITPFIYTLGGQDRELVAGAAYWINAEHPDTLAGYSTTPLTLARMPRPPEPGGDLTLVPRPGGIRPDGGEYGVDSRRIVFEAYPLPESPDEMGDAPPSAHLVVYVKYEADVKPADTARFYLRKMGELGWEVVDWRAGQDDAFLEFFRQQGQAQFMVRIDILGGTGVHIQFKRWEPGADLPDVPRYQGWPAIVMVDYEQSGGQTFIDYQPLLPGRDRINPQDVVNFYWYNWGTLMKLGWQPDGLEWSEDFKTAIMTFYRWDEEASYSLEIYVSWSDNVIRIWHQVYED